MNKYIIFVGIGLELIGLIVLAVYFSEILEEKYTSKGLIMSAAIVLSLVLWMTHIVILLKKLKK